jgi:hypothetical protein
MQTTNATIRNVRKELFGNYVAELMATDDMVDEYIQEKMDADFDILMDSYEEDD